MDNHKLLYKMQKYVSLFWSTYDEKFHQDKIGAILPTTKIPTLINV